MVNKKIRRLRKTFATKQEREIADYIIRLVNEEPQVHPAKDILSKVYEKYGKSEETLELCRDVYLHLRYYYFRTISDNRYVVNHTLGIEYCKPSLWERIKKCIKKLW